MSSENDRDIASAVAVATDLLVVPIQRRAVSPEIRRRSASVCSPRPTSVFHVHITVEHDTGEVRYRDKDTEDFDMVINEEFCMAQENRIRFGTYSNTLLDTLRPWRKRDLCYPVMAARRKSCPDSLAEVQEYQNQLVSP